MNLLLIMIWILLPIYALPSVVESGPVEVPYTVREVLMNGGLAGSFLLVGFYRAQSVILARFPRLGSRRARSPRTR